MNNTFTRNVVVRVGTYVVYNGKEWQVTAVIGDRVRLDRGYGLNQSTVVIPIDMIEEIK